MIGNVVRHDLSKPPEDRTIVVTFIGTKQEFEEAWYAWAPMLRGQITSAPLTQILNDIRRAGA